MILYGLLALPNLALAAGAGFNCTKAASQIEQLICVDDALAEQDKQMGHLVTTLKQHFNTERRKTFLQGQRNWLSLRNEACMQNADRLTSSDRTECLSSVYARRIKELKELNNLPASVDIDAILDTHEKFSATHSHALLYFHDKDNIDWRAPRRPETCRAVYTLASGAWQYSSDASGDAENMFAHAICAFKIFSARKQPDNKTAVTVDFTDYIKYSNEFSCLSGFPGCRDLFPSYPVSFHDEAKMGHLKILDHRAKQPGPVSKYEKNALVLDIRESSFSIDEINYTINQIALGDFTHQGRQEALLQYTIWPGQGTYRSTQLILAYFDSKMKMIRPELIERDSIFMIKTQPMPSSYYREHE